MRRSVLKIGVISSVFMMVAGNCYAENWVKNKLKSAIVQSSYHDADSVKVKGKTLNWTEKIVLTEDGAHNYSVSLSKNPVCKQNIAKMGEVTQHQIDYQIENGKFRRVAKRNYNKKNEIVCTDKDMGNNFDGSWKKIERFSIMEDMYHNLVTRYKLGNI